MEGVCRALSLGKQCSCIVLHRPLLRGGSARGAFRSIDVCLYLMRACLHFLFGRECTQAPILMFTLVGPLLRRNAHALGGGIVASSHIPGFSRIFWQMLIAFVCNENMFYWGHRLLHCKPIYKYIHKKHHLYIGTRSFAAEYSHDLEQVLTAFIPFLAGVFLTREFWLDSCCGDHCLQNLCAVFISKGPTFTSSLYGFVAGSRRYAPDAHCG